MVKRGLATAATAVALGVALGACQTGTGGEDWHADVLQVCHNQANDELKAPATSSFGGDVVTGSLPRFTDEGYVDSQNSFGADIRTTYTCTAIHGSGDNWQVRVVLH